MPPVLQEAAPTDWSPPADGGKSARCWGYARELKNRVNYYQPNIIRCYRSTSTKSSHCVFQQSFSPDFLDIPAMLLFSLHELMSFLRARNSQMSWTRPSTQSNTLCHKYKKSGERILKDFVLYGLIRTGQWYSMKHNERKNFSPGRELCFIWYNINLLAELWWQQSALTGRDLIQPEFL